MKIYIAGPITGVPEYLENFLFGNISLRMKFPSAHIMNPAALPGGMLTADYMSICLPMVLASDAVAFLPGWQDSCGAKIERALAEYCGKQIIELEAP